MAYLTMGASFSIPNPPVLWTQHICKRPDAHILKYQWYYCQEILYFNIRIGFTLLTFHLTPYYILHFIAGAQVFFTPVFQMIDIVSSEL